MATLSQIITPSNILTATNTATLTNKTINIANNTLTGAQPTLVSGTSIKTVNSTSLLGSGDLAVGDVTLAGTQTLTNKTIDGASNTLSNISVASGGTGTNTLAANNVIIGNGTSAPLFVAPGTLGNVLTSDGTTWASTALPVSGATKGQAIAFSLIFGL